MLNLKNHLRWKRLKTFSVSKIINEGYSDGFQNIKLLSRKDLEDLEVYKEDLEKIALCP